MFCFEVRVRNWLVSRLRLPFRVTTKKSKFFQNVCIVYLYLPTLVMYIKNSNFYGNISNFKTLIHTVVQLMACMRLLILELTQM